MDIQLKQPLHGSPDPLRPGEIVVIDKDGYWQRSQLSSHAGKRSLKNGSLYWNLTGLDENWTVGCRLFPGQSWGVLRQEDANLDLDNVMFVVPETPENNEEVSQQEEGGVTINQFGLSH